MTIGVANLLVGCGKSTCAVNLACELAGIEIGAKDRWQGAHRVVLVDADHGGAASRYWAEGRLPVSGEYLPLDDPTNMAEWVAQIEAISVDYVVVDGPSRPSVAPKGIMLVSDLVVIPSLISAAGLAATAQTIDLVRLARAVRADGGPKCLLIPVSQSPSAVARKSAADLLLAYEEPVGPAICRRPAFASAALEHRWIGDFAPGGAAHADIRTLAMHVRTLE